jgi:hypothetical protein
MVSIKKILIIFFLSFSLHSFGQSITARASVDSTDYLVGDFIHYSLEVKYFKDILVTLPFIRDSLNHLEIIKESEPVITVDEIYKTAVYNFTLSYYDSADISIQPIAVKFKLNENDSVRTILSNPVSFTVNTVEVDLQAEIKDIKSPLTIPLDWKFITLIVLLSLAVIVALYFLYRRYKKKKSEQPVEQKIYKIPSYIKALQSLENLEKQQLWQQGKVKDYHSDITGIIRNYFEERFKLPALELTTRESIERLKRVREGSHILETTDKFLNNADLVKFAKFNPIASINEEMMIQAKEIVNQTIPKVREAEGQNV